jgi:hypothetical protein
MKAFICADQPSTHIRPREINNMTTLRQLICVFYETQQMLCKSQFYLVTSIILSCVQTVIFLFMTHSTLAGE